MSILMKLSDETRSAIEKDPKVAYYFFCYLSVSTPLEFQVESYVGLAGKIQNKLKRSDVKSIRQMVEIAKAFESSITERF